MNLIIFLCFSIFTETKIEPGLMSKFVFLLILVTFSVIFRVALKGATSRFSHLEQLSLKFSSLLFVIGVTLLHPQPSLFLYGLLTSDR